MYGKANPVDTLDRIVAGEYHIPVVNDANTLFIGELLDVIVLLNRKIVELQKTGRIME